MTAAHRERVIRLTRTNTTMIYAVAGVAPLLYLRLPLHFDEAIFLLIGDQ